MTVSERITRYLTSGGLFNPELAGHEDARGLLIDCRTALAASEARQVKAREALDAAHYFIDASDMELFEEGITRDDALLRARNMRVLSND